MITVLENKLQDELNANPYSTFKILHHYDKIKKLRKGEHPSPISVRLVLSDLCNQNCHFCTFRMEGSFTNKLFGEPNKKGIFTLNPSRFLSKEKSLEIIKDCSEMGVKSIEFTGGGEPTVHPDHVEIFSAVLDGDMDFGLITNGVLFKEGFEDIILKSTWCRFSLDAGNAKTYSKIRETPESTFDKVLENIRRLTEKKKQINSETTLGLSFIVTDENYSEIYDAAKISSELGVDYFRIGYYRTDEGFTAGDFEKSKNLIENATKDFTRKDFTIIDRYTTSSKNMDGPPDYKFCGYQQVSTWIAADYNVYRCCVTSYDKHGLVGSLKNQSFKELWNSEEKRKKFDDFNAKSCVQCIYNDKNRAINFLIEKEPEHKNFI